MPLPNKVSDVNQSPPARSVPLVYPCIAERGNLSYWSMHHQNATKIAASSHDPQSKLGHLVKDLYYTLDLDREARTSLPIAELVSQIYTAGLGLRERGEKAISPVSEAGRRPA